MRSAPRVALFILQGIRDDWVPGLEYVHMLWVDCFKNYRMRPRKVVRLDFWIAEYKIGKKTDQGLVKNITAAGLILHLSAAKDQIAIELGCDNWRAK